MKRCMRLMMLSIVCLGCSALMAAEPKMEPVNKWIESSLPQLLEDYRWLHTHPEVSFKEEETAKFVAKQWRDAGLLSLRK